MNIVGQEKLLNKINSYTLQTFPKTVLLLGKSGCGKHLFSNYIAEKFNSTLIDITDTISFDLILDISIKPTFSFYLIDLDKINEKQQNVILKFIEEPSTNADIILLSSSKENLLSTIVNRCQIFNFEEYTDEQLKLFLNDNNEDILKVIRTPGKLKYINYNTIDDLKSLCHKIVTSINKAPYYNTLSISDKLNYSDLYDKFDVDLFLSFLKSEYVETKNKECYNIVNEVCRKLNFDSRLNKQYLIENMLTKLWEINR